MIRTSEAKASKENEEIRRLEQIVNSRQFTGNSLLPEFTRLMDQYKRLAHQAEASARENRRLRTQLVEMSRSLELTTRVDLMSGLANRRDILRRIEQEFSRAHRHQRTFSVILADIDEFKKVNDAHGFNLGDEVLVEVANVLKSCIRSEDACARWGGEQFLLLLPETALEGAEAVAQKICQTVAMTEFRVNKPGVRITMSLGVGNYVHGQTTFETIARAEQALAQAKESGKNRYSVAER
ncbi:MAG TPA: GGDEF domain-containing protein [Geobacteraceae bacterium]